jgi:prepilin-type processing-associated H-X9-DG protein
MYFPGTYYAKQCWSAHGQLLAQLEQSAIYNSINFFWGVDTPTGSTSNVVNTTAIYSKVAGFLCPSDPNTGAQPSPNNYFASVGTTANFTNGGNTNVSTLADHPTTGFFGYQVCYGLRDATDGSSSTIAFCESTIGNPNGQLRQNNIGIVNVSIPAGALLQDASTNIAQTQAGLQACNQAWLGGTSGYASDNRGFLWAYGSLGQSMLNTIATPNSIGGWTYCSNLTSSALVTYAEADSDHPGGVNTLMGDGSVRFVKNSVNIQTWMALGTKSNGEVIDSSSF